jgi:hemerythrin-like metal-binding protein
MGTRWSRPDWLYEALPYLYVAIGLAVILALRGGIALFSGLTLITAGVVVAVLRMMHRRRRHRARLSSIARTMPGTSVMQAKLVWRNEYLSGHSAIDAQHRRLFTTGNLLLDAVRTSQPKEDVESVLRKLVGEFDSHFRTEESILEASNHGLAEDHKQVHRELRRRASTLLATYYEGKASIDEVALFLTRDLVASHIAKEASEGRFVGGRRGHQLL